MSVTSTKRGSETQQRIITAAAQLIHHQGANGTSVDEILVASNTGKSQFYHYFKSKDDLIHAVLTHWIQRSLDFAKKSWSTSNDPVEGIEALFDGAIQSYSKSGCQQGCPVASLALELGAKDNTLRSSIKSFYVEFQNLIVERLTDAQTPETPECFSNVNEQAVFITATFHGSLLLASVWGNTSPIATAKNAVVTQLRCNLQKH